MNQSEIDKMIESDQAFNLFDQVAPECDYLMYCAELAEWLCTEGEVAVGLAFYRMLGSYSLRRVIEVGGEKKYRGNSLPGFISQGNLFPTLSELTLRLVNTTAALRRMRTGQGGQVRRELEQSLKLDLRHLGLVA
jgi:hypothetical protein